VLAVADFQPAAASRSAFLRVSSRRSAGRMMTPLALAEITRSVSSLLGIGAVRS